MFVLQAVHTKVCRGCFPLHILTQKGVPFSWGPTEVTAFQTLKEKLTTGPVLTLPDLQKSFEVYCDACGRSLGAVLMQEGHVIAYESRLFSRPEMTAQIYEKELLAVIHALTQWRHYLLGADFIVFTDHQSLRYFLSQKQLSEKQMRWANILSQFHFQIIHVQGQKNVVADALSRKPLVLAISAIHHRSFEDMVDQYATDTDFADIFTRIRDGETVAGYSLREGYLMKKTMLCVTQPLREKVMTECHCPPFTGHRGIATTMKGVERYFFWP
ncbi:RNase H-like domain-containing protein [Enterobacter cloacae complex sp. GF14B]|uniref:RNase H-like domain-containing protein n=1 Tax=Enterobacter cloacae complex sp. GF14B TaxID=2511982 RepID=UPI002107D5C5|nr:RNase H-like domain-containing protein [Enterobacter cloacae complex sp. GF14B]